MIGYNDADLSFEKFYELSQKNCFYCGQVPITKHNYHLNHKGAAKLSIENGWFIYNGLDRVDNTLLHTETNIITCCEVCNYSKRERNIIDFYKWVINISNIFLSESTPA